MNTENVCLKENKSGVTTKELKTTTTGTPFMTTADVKVYFGKSARTIARWRAENGFPTPLALCSPNLYRRVEVEAWEHSKYQEGRHGR